MELVMDMICDKCDEETETIDCGQVAIIQTCCANLLPLFTNTHPESCTVLSLYSK